MEKGSKIFVAGHKGLVGSAILRALEKHGYHNLITRTSKELDLRNQQGVNDFMQTYRPQYVFLAAAKVGGIGANSRYGADFIMDNLLIETNVIKASHDNNVEKLLFLGSSCIYPKLAPQPIREISLMDGKLEPTNEPYAIAKIAGLSICRALKQQYGDNYISVMPTNLYGPYDNFDRNTSHVLPAMIRKFHDAKTNDTPFVTLWGSGMPLREFLHVDDLAKACILLMNCYDGEDIINIGSGKECSIRQLAMLIKATVGYNGAIHWDTSMPDGTPRKFLDISKILQTGWHPEIDLTDGIREVYEWFCDNIANEIR